MKKLVAFFSASGVTAEVSARLAKAAGADLYEIKPAVKYSEADLDWMNSASRSSVEMKNKSMRPEIITGDIDVSGYDIIYLGFPVWWYVAPTIVNTFLEAYDFSGKKIVVYATSGGSGFGKTIDELKPSAPAAAFAQSKLLNGNVTDDDLKEVAAIGKEA